MDLEEDMEATVKKTTRKIQTLKAQFQDHKSKWEAVSNTEMIQDISMA